MKLHAIGKYLESLAPLPLAESWDAVGWLVGDPSASAARVMTCLTVSPPTVDEAIVEEVDLVVTHHPIPFRPVARLTSDSYTGGLLWRLARAGIAVFSLHTAWDSAAQGINHQLAAAVGLGDIRPLIPRPELPAGLGAGRVGQLAAPISVGAIWRRLQPVIQVAECQYVGSWNRNVQRVAIGCGSGGSFLDAARRAECDLLITGEASFHTCLEAEGSGIQLLLLGHYGSERFAMETLSRNLQRAFPDLTVWPSQREADPIRWHYERQAPTRETQDNTLDDTDNGDTELGNA